MFIFVVACNNISDRFGFDNSDAGKDPSKKNEPHPFEVTEQSQQEELNPQQDQPTDNLKQVGPDSKFTCETESPALVMYDREAKGLFYCNQGAWSPIASQDKEEHKGQNLGQVSADKGKLHLRNQFLIKPSTDSFLCTQSENYPKSYICSKKDRMLKKVHNQRAETTLTRGR